MRPLPRPTLCPYTTLFRSLEACEPGSLVRDGDVRPRQTAHGENLLVELLLRGGIAQNPLHVADLRRDQLHRQETRSEEHTSELQSPCNLVCRLLLDYNNII